MNLSSRCLATGEFGAMGLEGAIKAGFKKELAAIEDQQEREKFYELLLAQLRERGKAVNIASYLEIDSVIDPAIPASGLCRA